MRLPVSWFKWSVFVSDEIPTDGDGNIVSGPFAGQYQGEQHEVSGLMFSPSRLVNPRPVNPYINVISM